MTIAALCLALSLFSPLSSAADQPVPSAEVARATVPAEKEVVASSGPWRLTFRVYKTTLRVGESLWYQVRLTNRGKKTLRVADEIFETPWRVRTNASMKKGVFVVVTDIKGKPVQPTYFNPAHDGPETRPYLDPEVDPELPELMEKWQKQGLSEYQVRWNAVEHVKQKRSAEALRSRKIIELKPGESVATLPWIKDGRAKPWLNQPAREPIGDFAELELFNLDEPGKYRVRAVYDRRYWFRTPEEWRDVRERAKKYESLRKLLAEDAKRKPGGDEVRAETTWIEITVLP